MILDTSFVIDLLRGKKSAEKKVEELDKNNRDVTIPTPVVFELFVGIVQADAPVSERRKVEELTNAYGRSNLKYEEAKTAGEILGSLLIKGKRVGLVDSLIASFALNRGEPILTRDSEHFERIEGITVESY